MFFWTRELIDTSEACNKYAHQHTAYVLSQLRCIIRGADGRDIVQITRRFVRAARDGRGVRVIREILSVSVNSVDLTDFGRPLSFDATRSASLDRRLVYRLSYLLDHRGSSVTFAYLVLSRVESTRGQNQLRATRRNDNAWKTDVFFFKFTSSLLPG